MRLFNWICPRYLFVFVSCVFSQLFPLLFHHFLFKCASIPPSPPSLSRALSELRNCCHLDLGKKLRFFPPQHIWRMRNAWNAMGAHQHFFHKKKNISWTIPAQSSSFYSSKYNSFLPLTSRVIRSVPKSFHLLDHFLRQMSIKKRIFFLFKIVVVLNNINFIASAPNKTCLLVCLKLPNAIQWLLKLEWCMDKCKQFNLGWKVVWWKPPQPLAHVSCRCACIFWLSVLKRSDQMSFFVGVVKL